MGKPVAKSEKSTKVRKNNKRNQDRQSLASTQTNYSSKCGYIEYKMPKAKADTLLKDRSGTDARMHPQAYLCKVVNESYGLKGYCTKVITY